jgi:phenylalanyl-tRNA synthetase alpha chain
MDAAQLENEALSAIAGASTTTDLDAARVRFLGRKSDLKQALRQVRDRETGMTLNAVRERLEASFGERQAGLERAELDRSLREDVVDPTLPGRATARGPQHPITQIRREVETTEYNFDALNFPFWHPARSPLASLYLNERTLLRTETSPGQIHAMQESPPPIYLVTLGRVYRRDTPDATHSPIFHQVEGLAIDKGLTMADLKGTLLYLMRALFGEEREVRFRTHYFPFTEPSMEPDVSCFNCGGEGCRICKHSGWIEMGGSGMVDPAVLEWVGYDPEGVSGFAFGLGLERIAQLRQRVPDVRLFWTNDLRFLRQF